MEERKHALLSASSAKRWLNCTPSAVAEDAVADGGSVYAREGTLAHAMGAKALKEFLGQPTGVEDKEIADLSDEFLTPEMEELVDGYVGFVKERLAQICEEAKVMRTATPVMIVEQRLDYSDIVPEGFGTGDAVIVGAKRLEIIDLKYGKGVEVDATENPQLMLYALGAIPDYEYAYQIDSVVMTIYQPRIGNVSRFEIGAEELAKWGREYVQPLAAVAFRGLGARKSGEWCKFCKVKGSCKTLAIESMGLLELNPFPDELDTDDFSQLLPKLSTIKDWVGAVEEEALATALNGNAIPGYKIVEGRSVRRFTDPDAIGSALRTAGFNEDQIWKPRELRTLTELEKSMGKKHFASIAGEWIEKPKGKPTLAPERDKRKAIDPKDEFKDIDIPT